MGINWTKTATTKLIQKLVDNGESFSLREVFMNGNVQVPKERENFRGVVADFEGRGVVLRRQINGETWYFPVPIGPKNPPNQPNSTENADEE